MKTIRYLVIALWVTLSFQITPCIGAPPEPYTCRQLSFVGNQDTLWLAEVAVGSSERLYFFDDKKGCPQKTEQCRKKAYVIRGGELIINAVRDGWACAWFQGKKRETVGWVDVKGLKFLQIEPSQDTTSWLGTWRFYDNHIGIVRAGKSLKVRGKARWYGGETGNIVHYGTLNGEITPVGGRAHLGDGAYKYDCTADFTLIGKYLIVHDNGHCGGMNVRFDGVYMKIQ